MKKTAIWGVALALALFAPNAGTAQQIYEPGRSGTPDDSPPADSALDAEETIVGTVTSVDPILKQVVVETEDGEEMTVSFDDGTPISDDQGSGLAIGELDEGDEVAIQASREEGALKASRIELSDTAGVATGTPASDAGDAADAADAADDSDATDDDASDMPGIDEGDDAGLPGEESETGSLRIP